MRADHAKVVLPDDRGRDSIRITSQKAWDDSTIVLDLSHMPEGCATWPAFWTLSQQGPWPHGGEIDVIEGQSCTLTQNNPLLLTFATIRRQPTELKPCFFTHHSPLHHGYAASSVRVWNLFSQYPTMN